MRIALQDLLHLVAKLFMPRRISVWPTTSQTRTPEGTGIRMSQPLRERALRVHVRREDALAWLRSEGLSI